MQTTTYMILPEDPSPAKLSVRLHPHQCLLAAIKDPSQI
jgi:hypothetical protein